MWIRTIGVTGKGGPSSIKWEEKLGDCCTAFLKCLNSAESGVAAAGENANEGDDFQGVLGVVSPPITSSLCLSLASSDCCCCCLPILSSFSLSFAFSLRFCVEPSFVFSALIPSLSASFIDWLPPLLRERIPCVVVPSFSFFTMVPSPLPTRFFREDDAWGPYRMNSNLVLFLRTTHTQRSERERERERERKRERIILTRISLPHLRCFCLNSSHRGMGCMRCGQGWHSLFWWGSQGGLFIGVKRSGGVWLGGMGWWDDVFCLESRSLWRRVIWRGLVFQLRNEISLLVLLQLLFSFDESSLPFLQ